MHPPREGETRAQVLQCQGGGQSDVTCQAGVQMAKQAGAPSRPAVLGGGRIVESGERKQWPDVMSGGLFCSSTLMRMLLSVIGTKHGSGYDWIFVIICCQWVEINTTK